jgi:hypothetical protein
MPVLTDLASAEVKRNVRTLYGKTLTRPALLVSEGIGAVYACDVNIGPTDPTGQIDQYINRKNGKSALLTGLPGQPPRDWQLEDSLTVNTVLHNVPISRNNADLVYADVGSPVIVSRSASGQWEITGFSQEMPGTYTLVPVDLEEMAIGEVIDLSIDVVLLTFAELGSLRPFGELPFGASAVYIGGALDHIE